jgi:hypothetical protein
MTITNEKILDRVKKFYRENAAWLGLAGLDEEEQDHLIQCGAAIIETYLGVNKYPHGSFVNAVAENNLRDAFAFADSTNTRGMKFHAMLLLQAYQFV